MPARRPSPLCEEIFEPRVAPAGITLLGRTNNLLPPSSAKKNSAEGGVAAVQRTAASPSATTCLTPMVVHSPACSSVSRAAQQSHQWSYTPMATPSPWGRSFYHSDGGLLVKATDLAAEFDDEDKGTFAFPPRLPSGSTEADLLSDSDDESDEGPGTPLQAVARPVAAPKPPLGALYPSLGSKDHAAGTCKRCCFFPRGRCANGYQCLFCHCEHDRRKRKNKKNKVAKGAGYASQFPATATVSSPVVPHLFSPPSLTQSTAAGILPTLPAGLLAQMPLAALAAQIQMFPNAAATAALLQLMPQLVTSGMHLGLPTTPVSIPPSVGLGLGANPLVQQQIVLPANPLATLSNASQAQQPQVISLEPAFMPHQQNLGGSQLQQLQHLQHLNCILQPQLLQAQQAQQARQAAVGGCFQI